MEFLKWAGSVILAILTLTVLLAVGGLVGVLGVSLGAISMGAFVVFLVAFAIREAFGSSPKSPDPGDEEDA